MAEQWSTRAIVLCHATLSPDASYPFREARVHVSPRGVERGFSHYVLDLEHPPLCQAVVRHPPPNNY